MIVTPETHRRVNARPTLSGSKRLAGLHEAFGWSRPFPPSLLPDGPLPALLGCDLAFDDGQWLRSRVRFSSLGDDLDARFRFYPTLQQDASLFWTRHLSLLRVRETPGRSRRVPGRRGLQAPGAGGPQPGLSSRQDHPGGHQRASAGLRRGQRRSFAGVRVTLQRSWMCCKDRTKPSTSSSRTRPTWRDALARSYRDGGGQHAGGVGQKKKSHEPGRPGRSPASAARPARGRCCRSCSRPGRSRSRADAANSITTG